MSTAAVFRLLRRPPMRWFRALGHLVYSCLSLMIQYKLAPVQDRPLHIFRPDASISFKRLKRDFHFCRSRTTGKTREKDILNNFRIGLAARQQLFDASAFFSGNASVD